jgi:hypothetical protein
VWVNRLWHYHFGRGIVATPGDFGLAGDPPTHPELLDYLASELVDSGWSTKRVHRHIVQSSAYRQTSTSAIVDAGATADADNRYLWHFPARRLESEALRDAILAVSGELAPTAGGPGVDTSARNEKKDENGQSGDDEPPRIESLRQSVYLQQRRDRPAPMQQLFDGPTTNESCPRRHVSTVSLQPLFLLNSEFMVDRARAFARRVYDQAGDDVSRQIEIACITALGRSPDDDERQAAVDFFADGGDNDGARETASGVEDAAEETPRRLIQFCHALLNLNEFVYIE